MLIPHPFTKLSLFDSHTSELFPLCERSFFTSNVITSFQFLVPSKAPYVQVTSPNSTSLNVTWKPIDKRYLHGVHRGYCVFYDGKHLMNIAREEMIIPNLRPYTEHHIQVSAQTTPGCGAKSPIISVFTMEDSKFS
jgi:hypothetical protein